MPRPIRRGITGPLLFVISVLVGAPPGVEAQSARMSGSIDVDLLSGSLEGDVCLDNVPEAGDTVLVVLNRSLTIKHVRGAAETPARMELERGGDAVRYTFRRDSVAVEELRAGRRPSLCVNYLGSSPIYDIAAGDYRSDDNSSLIAFNGRTVRARGASRWYPAPIDPGTSLPQEAIRFDLTINCEACEQIYVNGNPPQTGPIGTFTSAEPRELLLLAGALPLTRVGPATIVGEAVRADSAAAFMAMLADIQDFHADYLGVAPPPLPDILRAEPLRAPRRGQLWGFYSDPALMLIGVTIPRFVEVLEGDSIVPRRNIYTFLAHELAHHYFGWHLGTTTAQRDFFGEPFATFLELKAMRARFGAGDYRRAITSLRDRVLRGPEPVPVDEASQDQLERARYGSAPLQLLALEASIGEERMRLLLRGLVTAPEEEQARADLGYMREVALRVGVPLPAWQRWEQECLRSPLAGNLCLQSLGE